MKRKMSSTNYYDTTEGQTKVEELFAVIGKDVTQNLTPTCHGKLIGLDVEAGLAIMEVVENPESFMQKYNIEGADKIGTYYTRSIGQVWNSFFF